MYKETRSLVIEGTVQATDKSYLEAKKGCWKLKFDVSITTERVQSQYLQNVCLTFLFSSVLSTYSYCAQLQLNKIG